MMTSDMTTPWRASDGAVRKKRPLSSTVDSAGEVAEGDTMTMPFGTATLVRIEVVTPEQSAPTMPSTPSEVIRRSAAALAAALSMQVESARIEVTDMPSISAPLSVTSAIASSAPSAMAGVSDSIGPVKPRITPSVTLLPWASANAAPVRAVEATVAIRIFFMSTLPVYLDRFGPGLWVGTYPYRFERRKEAFALLR
jgi:hypothetical protein